MMDTIICMVQVDSRRMLVMFGHVDLLDYLAFTVGCLQKGITHSTVLEVLYY